MPKILMDVDEVYPVYTPNRKLNEGYRQEVVYEVSEETLAKWEHVAAEYKQIQEEMAALRGTSP